MNKRAAKRWACRCAWELLHNGHNNGFLYEDETRDGQRKLQAWDELLEELARRGFSQNEPGHSEEKLAQAEETEEPKPNKTTTIHW